MKKLKIKINLYCICDNYLLFSCHLLGRNAKSRRVSILFWLPTFVAAYSWLKLLLGLFICPFVFPLLLLLAVFYFLGGRGGSRSSKRILFFSNYLSVYSILYLSFDLSAPNLTISILYYFLYFHPISNSPISSAFA